MKSHSKPKSLAERLEWMADNLPGFRDELEAVQSRPPAPKVAETASQAVCICLNDLGGLLAAS